MQKVIAVAALLFSIACGVENALETTSETLQSESFFSVEPDTRKCAFPYCGGYWVARANKTLTQCADGRYKTQCYVATIDWSNSDLLANEQHLGSHNVIYGALALGEDNFGVLYANELWNGMIETSAEGSYYVLTATQIYCIRAPCHPLITAYKLNTNSEQPIRAITGLHSSAVNDLLTSQKLIGVGKINRDGYLNVSQYFTRTMHDESLSCTNDSDCVFTTFYAPIHTANDCYCPLCPVGLMNQTTAQENAAAFQLYCSAIAESCPVARCIPPPTAVCVNNQCTPITDGWVY